MIVVKYSRLDFIKSADRTIRLDEQMTFGLSKFPHRLNGLREVNDVWISGQLHYDETSELVLSNLDVRSSLVIGCAITDEDVDYPLQFEFDESFSFIESEDESVHVVKHDVIDLGSYLFQSILAQVPLKVVKKGTLSYPKGEGWELLTQKEFEQCEKPIDPRLAKLKEFKAE